MDVFLDLWTWLTQFLHHNKSFQVNRLLQQTLYKHEEI